MSNEVFGVLVFLGFVGFICFLSFFIHPVDDDY